MRCNQAFDQTPDMPDPVDKPNMTVGSITACAQLCAKYHCQHSASSAPCCDAFTFKPVLHWPNQNCFLKQLTNSTLTSPVLVPYWQGRTWCVAAVSAWSVDAGINQPVCRQCAEFDEELHGGPPGAYKDYGDWILRCNVNINKHDIGALASEPVNVGSVRECADQCWNHGCTGSNTVGCCQAFTYVYGWRFHNCFLKSGLTLETDNDMVGYLRGQPPCVETVSVWASGQDWCNLDPKCRQAKEDANKSLWLGGVALGVSCLSLIVAAAQACDRGKRTVTLAAWPKLTAKVDGRKQDIPTPLQTAVASWPSGPISAHVALASWPTQAALAVWGGAPSILISMFPCRHT